MRVILRFIKIFTVLLMLAACKKSGTAPTPDPLPTPKDFDVNAWQVGEVVSKNHSDNISVHPTIKLKFGEKINRSTVALSISVAEAAGTPVGFTADYENSDSTVVIRPSAALRYLSRYRVVAITTLKSVAGGKLKNTFDISFNTRLDSSRKFPIISDDSLLTLVQKQTFKYFWDFGHPVSGMARERNTSGDLVTTGGTGFGIMSIVTAVHRNFITRAQGLERLQTMVGFLKTKATTYKGAFPHWLNGITGNTIAFSAKDNGADLMETSLLMMGLLTARQYFANANAAETALRNDINGLWNAVQWNWFRKNNENVLYWHWSPDYNWDMNLPIRGWNEGLIAYVLAAASPLYSVPKEVYTNGWANNGASGFKNGNTYYGHTLPLGPAFGGPLFFSHYSFLGINPTGLADVYANYMDQNTKHSLINMAHAISNPQGYYGYSDSVWGLTASDIPGGYSASSPTNDLGVIAPTAAISSMPYTPAASMKALKFFYYVLGDKLWGTYGFKDAFSLKENWFADSYLAIDQGPIIIMIENHRSGLLWSLFTSAPEVKAGMKKLGFTAPYLP